MSEEARLNQSTNELRPEIEKDTAIEGIPVSPELLDKLPPEVRNYVLMMSHYQRIGAPPNPLANKITSEHIDKIIESSEKDSEREFKSKWFTLIYSVLALGFLVFVFIYLPTIDKDLFKEVLKILLTFLGGLGTGFGISKFRQKDD